MTTENWHKPTSLTLTDPRCGPVGSWPLP